MTIKSKLLFDKTPHGCLASDLDPLVWGGLCCDNKSNGILDQMVPNLTLPVICRCTPLMPMHIWNTKALAAKLRDGTLSEHERMKYFLALAVVIAVITEIPVYLPEPVSPPVIALSLVGVIGVAVGTYATYLANRKGDNRDFIARSICLTWPLGARLGVLLLSSYTGYLVIGSLIGGEAFDRFTEHTTWVDFGFGAIIEVVFYWRLWRHLTWISTPRHVGIPQKRSEGLVCGRPRSVGLVA